LSDGASKITLRAWNDTPQFALCDDIAVGDFLEIEGEFAQNPPYGLDARNWNARPLEEEEIETLLAGPTELREKQTWDWEDLNAVIERMRDPRLQGVCRLFLEEFGERFRRAAAARNYHHARRGGLLEHTAQMVRAAEAMAGIYTELNSDLLCAGVLFHDAGKLWESCPPAHGFGIALEERGELIGHISIGIELLNTLWRKLMADEAATAWNDVQPGNEAVRNHLIHLIAAHHGEMEFGSPVFPKTPEAFALHYLDNLDAKLEMLAAGYRNGTPLATRIIDRVRPLPGNLVLPLEKWEASG